MTDRIELAGLSVARELKAFIADEALPGTGVDEAAFWQVFRGDRPRPRAEEPRAARQARGAAGPDRPWHRDNGAPSDLEAYKNFLQRDRLSLAGRPGLPGRDRQCRSRDRGGRRPAARRSRDERALCAERRQCALGLALRRALRHRRDPRDRRRREGRGYNPEARRQGHRLGEEFPRRSRAARRRQLGSGRRARDRRRDAELSAGGKTVRLRRCRAIRRLSRRAGLSRRRAAEQ